MSKKVLFSIPESQGGWLKDIIDQEPEIINDNSDIAEELKPVSSTEEYMTVADYASFTKRPKTVIYRMIKDGKLKSIKIDNKLNIII